MECEELLTEKQLKQLKALKIKYAAELIQHKKIKDEDVIKSVPKDKKENINNDEDDDNNEEFEGDEELEEIDDDNDEEKNLKEKIPDFEKILKKEKLTLDDKIKKYYSEDDAFEEDQESKKVTELLSEIMNIPNETHMDILQKNFEKEKLKNLPDLEGLDNLEDLEYKLFEKDEFYPEGYSVISNLENLQTWIYKFRNIAEEKPFIMVNALRYFNHWRMCLNDGNSFYRVNMFSLLEHCIIQKDLENENKENK